MNGVGPTFVRTDLTTALFANADFNETIKWYTPMGKEAEPADIAPRGAVHGVTRERG